MCMMGGYANVMTQTSLYVSQPCRLVEVFFFQSWYPISSIPVENDAESTNNVRDIHITNCSVL